MKKIGIITHYHDSINYGGNFQAYALCEFLNQNDFQPEQLSFPFKIVSLVEYPKLSLWKKMKKKGLKAVFNRIIRRLEAKKKQKIEQEIINQKSKAFYNFNQKIIPHSQTVYGNETIQNAANNYDVFITGSDQVWNLNWYNPAYFLSFAGSDKIKLSYAASMAMDSITEAQKELITEHLKDFKAVSVRERNAVDLLQGTFSGEIQHVLDPTLLLSKSDWDAVKEEYPIDGKYIFCYFLGNNAKERKLAKDFAKKHNLKLMAIANGYDDIKYFKNSLDCKVLFDISPQQFLFLVEHAEYVFTDSFHAVVFSFIYQKQYYVFNRSANGEMSSRITSILELFKAEPRFCTGDKEQLSYLEALPDIDYTQKLEVFEDMKERSKKFLLDNL